MPGRRRPPPAEATRGERLEELLDRAGPFARLLTPAGVLAIIPIALAILNGIDENREASCAAIDKVSAVVRVDDELERPVNAELRRQLLTPPAVCRELRRGQGAY